LAPVHHLAGLAVAGFEHQNTADCGRGTLLSKYKKAAYFKSFHIICR
jgi:hypothetical protein